MPATAGFDAGDGGAVHGDQSTPDVKSGGFQDPAVVDQREFRGAPADVHVEDSAADLVGGEHGPGPVGREHGLHVVTCRRTDHVGGAFGGDAADLFGVAAPQRLTGQDHHTGVDVLRFASGVGVGGVEQPAQRDRVDVQIFGIRGQGDVGLEQRVAGHDDVTTGEVLPTPAQVKSGERHLGPRAADVDADAVQRDVVLLPDRIVLQRRIGFVGMVVVGVVVHAGAGAGASDIGGRSASSAA